MSRMVSVDDPPMIFRAEDFRSLAISGPTPLFPYWEVIIYTTTWNGRIFRVDSEDKAKAVAAAIRSQLCIREPEPT